MNSLQLLQDYPNEVLNLFIQHYKKMISKDLNVKFTDVLNSTFSELDLQDYNDDQIKFLYDWYNNIHHLHFLNKIIAMPFEEIIFHTHSFYQRVNQGMKTDEHIDFLSTDDFQLFCEILALKHNISWNYSEPFASFTFSINENEIRATLIHHSTSGNKISKLFLRSIQRLTPHLEEYQIDDEQISLIEQLIVDKKNILISGPTGSGKTTFMRSLMNKINKEEHVIVLEDTHEILNTSHHFTSMLSINESHNKSLKNYCSYALRMSPDRIIIGEMRSHEVVPFMLAMNSGHRGLMSTIHANSAIDAISRLSLLFSLYSDNKEIQFELITKLASKNIDYVIHLEDKKIKEIAKVLGSEKETAYFEKIYEAS